MSIVADRVRRVDGQLDRVHLRAESLRLVTTTRVKLLQSIVKSLSTTSSLRPVLSSSQILALLEQASLKEIVKEDEEATATVSFETDLEWILVSKATVQTYGLLLNTLLEQTIPLSDDIWYWNEVLSSYRYIGLYAIQTSPLRWWAWTKDIYSDTRNRIARLRDGPRDENFTRDIGASSTDQWEQFYGLVRDSIRERSVADIQRRVLSPIALCRNEVRQKQRRLKRLREMSASGLGVLMDEGLSFDISDESYELVNAESESDSWKLVVERSVALMVTVLRNVTAIETGVPDFEDTVFASVEDDPEISGRSHGTDDIEIIRPAMVSRRLQNILKVHVPNHINARQKLASEYGRPSRLLRYWLPATTILLSSTTILRILINRKADIISWVRDFGATVRDFCINWVLVPTKNVIGTIRRDKDSEVAIMSKESLKGDRDSLERMVVDFAIDNPKSADYGPGPLNEVEISDIRAKVKEGDLTPVLRAYEKDLRSPFKGAIRGDLVRTLLIQVQKTKVDVEIAISGIDALLKSQELVFGFIGLTPGVLVCFAVFRYLGGTFGNRKGIRQGKKAGQTVRVLRNIDRILTLATPTQTGFLSYKDHGLLLCEIHVLLDRARSLFPGEVEREFLEDVKDLCNINSGIHVQLKVLERIRWAYSKWLR